MICSSCIITACYHSVVQKASQAKPPECRTVQHKLGETCIPLEPQRIIALGVSWTLDPVLALGMKPIATNTFRFNGREYFPGLSDSETIGIETVGNESQPSLEKVLMLHPDLVIALDLAPQLYKPISVIAPTVVREFEKIKFSFKENLRSIAKLLNREQEAERILAQYEARVEGLRILLENQSQKPEVSVIYHVGGGFSIPASEAICFQVLNDLGARIKPVLINQPEYIPLSIEIINEYDADILFIVDFDNKPPSYFWQNSIISSLRSAKNNQVHVVKADTWFAYGPLGIDKLLDEIFMYLSKASHENHHSHIQPIITSSSQPEPMLSLHDRLPPMSSR
jgi:iron complex transport system substrate-binding protein